MVFGGLLWRRKRLSVDLAGASSLPRAGCSDATPVASTYEGFRIGEDARPSTSFYRMCVPAQALYLPSEDWSAYGTTAEGLSWSKPLAFNFDNHALSNAIAHQQSDWISVIRPHGTAVDRFLLSSLFTAKRLVL